MSTEPRFVQLCHTYRALEKLGVFRERICLAKVFESFIMTFHLLGFFVFFPYHLESM